MPENITFNVTSSRSVILSWDPPGQELRNGTILSYSIHCSSDNHVEFSFWQTIPVPSQSVSMTGLNPFTSYNCCIASITTNGNSPCWCSSGITLQDGKLVFVLPTILPKQAPIFVQALTPKFWQFCNFVLTGTGQSVSSSVFIACSTKLAKISYCKQWMLQRAWQQNYWSVCSLAQYSFLTTMLALFE